MLRHVVLLSIFCASVSAAEPLVNRIGMNMHLLRDGFFMMGERSGNTFTKAFNDHGDYNTKDETPRHPVRLTRPFRMSETEVTVGQFKKFVAATGYKTEAEQSGKGMLGWKPQLNEHHADRHDRAFKQEPAFTWKSPGFDQGDAHPVVGISWRDAKAFCTWLGKVEGLTCRLPTEAEWEYACRAGTENYFSWGDGYRETVHGQANTANAELEKAYADLTLRQWLMDSASSPGDPHVTTAPVGSYPPNAWGLRDLHGNVWEWCEDLYMDTTYNRFRKPKHDQAGPLTIDPLHAEAWNEHGEWRAIRGGAYCVAPAQCRSATRAFFEAGDAAAHLGFRVVYEMKDPAAEQRFAMEQALRKELGEKATLKSYRSDELIAEFNGPPDPAFIARLHQLPELTGIIFKPRNQFPPECIAQVAKISGLRVLEIHGAGDALRSEHLAPLAGAAINRLHLSAGKVDDQAMAIVATFKDLKSLHLEADVTDTGLARLSALPLEKLTVEGTRAHGAFLAGFSKDPMKELSINGFEHQHLAGLSGFSKLESLRLRASGLQGASLRHLEGLRHLKHLDLTGSQELKDADFAPLARLTQLQGLVLRQTRAGDQAARAIATLPWLQRLEIGSEALSDQGLRELCALVSLRDLQLHEEANRITDGGLRDAWRLANLERVWIRSPGLTGKGLLAFAEAERLRQLNFQGIQPDTEVIETLKALHPNLEIRR